MWAQVVLASVYIAGQEMSAVAIHPARRLGWGEAEGQNLLGQLANASSV